MIRYDDVNGGRSCCTVLVMLSGGGLCGISNLDISSSISLSISFLASLVAFFDVLSLVVFFDVLSLLAFFDVSLLLTSFRFLPVMRSVKAGLLSSVITEV